MLFCEKVWTRWNDSYIDNLQYQVLLLLLFKSVGSVRFFECFWNKSYAHQGCIYMIKNTVNAIVLWNTMEHFTNNYYNSKL